MDKRQVFRIAQSVSKEAVAKNAPAKGETKVADLAAGSDAAAIVTKVNDLLAALRTTGVIPKN